MVDARERRVEPAEVVADRARAVDVEGCAVFGGERGEVDALAAELAVVVVEGVHGERQQKSGVFFF